MWLLFWSCLITGLKIDSTSQPTVEAKLDELLREFRKGHREGSVMSEQTVDSLSTADKKVWRSIRKELEDLGLSLAAFDANKDFIFSWLIKAIADGAFEEQAEDMDEVGSSSDSEFSGSASTTRPELPHQESSEALRLETTSSSSPDDSTRSVLGERSGSHLPRFPFSSPMHSSESLVQPPVQPPEILHEINKWRLWRNGTQNQTDAEQVYEVGEGDAQHSSTLAFQIEQGHPGAKSTPLSPLHSLESLLQRPESAGKRGPQARRNVKQIYELEGDHPQKPLVQTSQTGQGNPSAKITTGDDGVEPSPSTSSTRLEFTKAPLSAQEIHNRWQPFKGPLNRLLGWVTMGNQDEDLINILTHRDPKEALRLLRSQSRPQSWASHTIYCALSLAVRKGYTELLEPLLKAGQVGINDHDLLSEAVEYHRTGAGGVVTLQRLLSLGADPSLCRGSCILRAIEVHDEDALRTLLKAGVDINANIGWGADILPLHGAMSLYASNAMIRMLISNGADVNRPSPARKTALGLAIAERREYVAILISHGADIEKSTQFSGIALPMAPLMGAIIMEELSIAKLLVGKGANIKQHYANISVLDVFYGYHDTRAPFSRLLRLLAQAPACAVHAAVVHDFSATYTLRMLLQAGARTNWDIALILAFVNREHHFKNKGQAPKNPQGTLVAVLTKCSESRGISWEFSSTDSHVFDVMGAGIASTNEKDISDDDSYLRLLVDEVISKCH